MIDPFAVSEAINNSVGYYLWTIFIIDILKTVGTILLILFFLACVILSIGWTLLELREDDDENTKEQQ